MPVRAGHINVCELLNREYSAMDAVARARGVSVSIHRCEVPAAECMHFFGDPGRIGQIIKNVMLNAIRYTPKGGSVTIDCERHADQLEVRIADTGPASPKKTPDASSSPAFRGSASQATDGSGYGLAVVKQLVEAQGGSVVGGQQRLAGGAMFTVRLPGVAPPMLRACARVAGWHEPPSNSKRGFDVPQDRRAGGWFSAIARRCGSGAALGDGGTSIGHLRARHRGRQRSSR